MTNDFATTVLAAPARSTRAMIAWTLVALLPSLGMRIHLFGAQAIMKLTIALVTALLCEGVFCWLRKQPLRDTLDGSAVISAILFALCIPPATPGWLCAFGVVVAITLGKHVFGGLGRNLFNPAMLSYALVLVVFPATMLDAMSAYRSSMSSGYGLAIAATCGGLWLVGLRIVRWQLPLAFCVGVTVTALAFHSGMTNPLDSLTNDTAMLAAFFIVSDPVSGCSTARGRWLFGIGAGALWIVLGHLAHALDPLPFAILAMNALAPAIDQLLHRRRAIRPQHG